MRYILAVILGTLAASGWGAELSVSAESVYCHQKDYADRDLSGCDVELRATAYLQPEDTLPQALRCHGDVAYRGTSNPRWSVARGQGEAAVGPSEGMEIARIARMVLRVEFPFSYWPIMRAELRGYGCTLTPVRQGDER